MTDEMYDSAVAKENFRNRELDLIEEERDVLVPALELIDLALNEGYLTFEEQLEKANEIITERIYEKFQGITIVKYGSNAI